MGRVAVGDFGIDEEGKDDRIVGTIEGNESSP